jgi:hypothetical protein
MKNKIIIGFFLIPSLSFSGMPVTDPTSYTYMMDQISKTTELINKTTDQIETLGGIRTQVDQVKQSMHGVYNKTMGAINNAKRAEERLSNATLPIKETMDINDTSGAYGGSDVEDYSENVKKYLDTFFADPRTITAEDDGLSLAQLSSIKKTERQAALRATIMNAEQVMSDSKTRMQNLEDLANAIDSTENIKDSQDLTNRFLYEILQLMNEFLSVYLISTEATALHNYDGYNEESAKKEKKEFLKNGNLNKGKNKTYNDFMKEGENKGWYK